MQKRPLVFLPSFTYKPAHTIVLGFGLLTRYDFFPLVNINCVGNKQLWSSSMQSKKGSNRLPFELQLDQLCGRILLRKVPECLPISLFVISRHSFGIRRILGTSALPGIFRNKHGVHEIVQALVSEVEFCCK